MNSFKTTTVAHADILLYWDEQVGELPDNGSFMLGLLKARFGKTALETAIQKVADMDEYETSEEVLAAVRLLLKKWDRRKPNK